MIDDDIDEQYQQARVRRGAGRRGSCAGATRTSPPPAPSRRRHSWRSCAPIRQELRMRTYRKAPLRWWSLW